MGYEILIVYHNKWWIIKLCAEVCKYIVLIKDKKPEISLSFYVIHQIIWYGTKQRNTVTYWKKSVLVNIVWLKAEDTVWLLTLAENASCYKLINKELETLNKKMKKME